MADASTTTAKAGIAMAVSTFVADARRFAEDELWERDLNALSRAKRSLFSFARISVIVIKGFVADNCALQASALTYITLMSMVPVLALMLSVSKGLGYQERLMHTVGLTRGVDGALAVVADSRLSQMPSEAIEVAKHVYTYVDNTNFGTLGVIGLLLLVWSVLKAVGRVENSFNLIWGVKEPRSFFRRFTDYIVLLIFVPILLLLATSANAALSSTKLTTAIAGFSGSLFWLYERGIRVVGMSWVILAFFLLYMWIPNTKVRLFPALVAGLVGATLWYASQWIYIEGQVGLTRLNAIYGTFAAVPFFLLWVYVSWFIVLFGAEVGFATQNHRTFILESGASDAPPAAKELLGLAVVCDACRSYRDGEHGWSAPQFGVDNAIPARLLSEVTFVLTERGILLPLADRDGCFVPGKDTRTLTVGEVEEAFRGSRDPYVKRLPAFEQMPAAQVFLARYRTFAEDLGTLSFSELLPPDGKAQSS